MSVQYSTLVELPKKTKYILLAKMIPRCCAAMALSAIHHASRKLHGYVGINITLFVSSLARNAGCCLGTLSVMYREAYDTAAPDTEKTTTFTLSYPHQT